MQNTQYPSDLTNTEWKILQPLLPPRRKRGRPPTDRRLVLNAIRYVLRSGCAWRMVLHHPAGRHGAMSALPGIVIGTIGVVTIVGCITAFARRRTERSALREMRR